MTPQEALNLDNIEKHFRAFAESPQTISAGLYGKGDILGYAYALLQAAREAVNLPKVEARNIIVKELMWDSENRWQVTIPGISYETAERIRKALTGE